MFVISRGIVTFVRQQRQGHITPSLCAPRALHHVSHGRTPCNTTNAMTSRLRIAAILAICAATAPLHPASADEFTGQKSLGLQAGYTTYNRSAVAGIEFTYRFNRRFRLAPNVSYVFRHDHTDALLINLNAQVPISIGQKWEIFPLAGINYSSWNYHFGDIPGGHDDVGTRVSRFGINLGAGIGLAVTHTLGIGLTADYILIKEFHGCNILAKIAYRF